MDENRVFEILLRVRAGSINEADATRGEVEACVDAGLLERNFPNELRYTTTAAFAEIPGRMSDLASLPSDLASLPKVHPVSLTAQGQERLRARLGF